MRIERDVKLDYADVLFRPKRSEIGSRKDVDLHREYNFRNSGKTYKGIPIMAANMDGVGTFDMALPLAKKGMFTCLAKSYQPAEIWDWLNNHTNKDDLRQTVAVSTGITDIDLERIDKTLSLSRSIDYVCIDVANGYSERFIDFVKRFRDNHPNVTIIAGNVVTPDITEELILNGADIVKVGIGPGSVCTTRIKTGVGYPQLSAVIECADAAHGLGGHIIADGGCTCPGDVAKAFAAGADFVMLGGMLAGHDEGGGEVITKQYQTNQIINSGFKLGDKYISPNGVNLQIEEKQYVKFYGMSSKAANEKHFGGLKEYRSSEGREVLVPYRGEVGKTIQDILGGLRSTCTYAGAIRLKHLSKCTTFVRCTQTHNSTYESSTIGK